MAAQLKTLVYLLVFAVFSGSCERVITIDLPNDPDILVVEGSIEPGKNPIVIVSRNRSIFNNFPTDLVALLDTFLIKDALVTISDGSVTVPLAFTINPVAYPYIYYTTTSLVGEIGKTYSLTVSAKGKTVKSTTSLSPPVPIDSTWFELNIFDSTEDSLGFAFLNFKDPDTTGNAYRLYAKRNSETEYFPVQGTIVDDEFINGRLVSFFTGQSTKPFGVQDTFIDQRFFYTLGDTVYLKFCSIGRKEYKFYSTFETAISTNGNPFSSPTLIKSNIEGGQGIWCGFSPYYDTLYIPK
jgi:hypothetical protein